jgi:hypothetical protein
MVKFLLTRIWRGKFERSYGKIIPEKRRVCVTSSFPQTAGAMIKMCFPNLATARCLIISSFSISDNFSFGNIIPSFCQIYALLVALSVTPFSWSWSRCVFWILPLHFITKCPFSECFLFGNLIAFFHIYALLVEPSVILMSWSRCAFLILPLEGNKKMMHMQRSIFFPSLW